MKLTKKDKMMLLVLGLVIVVALFYVYGIMPLKETSEELDGQLAVVTEDYNKKKAALDEARENEGVYEALTDKVLEQYFQDKSKVVEMHKPMDKIAFEKFMVNLLKGYNASGYATSSWQTEEVNVTVPNDEVECTYTNFITKVPLSCDFKTFADYRRFLDDMRVSRDFELSSTSYVINDPNETVGGEDGPVKEYFEVTASFSIVFYSGEKYTSTKLPQALPDVLPTYGLTKDVLRFEPVENARSYEAYKVTIDEESGLKSFELIRGAEFVKNDDGFYTVKFTKEMLGKDKQFVFIRAVRNDLEFFKSNMLQSSEVIEVVIE